MEKKPQKENPIILLSLILGLIIILLLIVITAFPIIPIVVQNNQDEPYRSNSATLSIKDKNLNSKVDLSKWLRSYEFYAAKSSDHQMSLVFNKNGNVTQTQDKTDGRIFKGQSKISSSNQLVFTYGSVQNTATSPIITKKIAQVKIHVVWDCGGGKSRLLWLSARKWAVSSDG